MITRYGLDNFIVMMAVSIILVVIAFFISKPWLGFIFGILGFILAFFSIWFFRDPNRTVPEEARTDHSIVLSPADGEVMEIVEENEPYYMQCPVRRISIFLSPLDVHVNRVPVSGKVEFYKYVPGDYMVAYHPKSSEKNEHSKIGVQTEYGKILFKQIVGIIARRLVCELKVGDTVSAGDRFGMMKFGSRMDVMLPLGAKIDVKPGDRVVGGVSYLAHLEKTPK